MDTIVLQSYCDLLLFIQYARRYSLSFTMSAALIYKKSC